MKDVQVLGDYILIEQIGTGGMARVFRAISAKASTHVCLKVLHKHLSEDEQSVKMFIDEATICAELSHPHIVRLMDYGEVDGHYFIALELVLGKDLRTVIEDAEARDMRLTPVICVEITIALLRALDYIHNKRDKNGTPLSIIHRDVTPHNVMLAFDGDIKLTDFGVAKAAVRLSQTSAGSIKGKYGYMSPEQVRSKGIDARSDVFATGIVLHEMLTGRHLFLGESPYITIANLIAHPVHPPSHWADGIDEALDAIALKALEREPDNRYSSAKAMLGELESWIARRALTGDVADVGAFVRDLYGLELTEDQGPRRLSSDEIAALSEPAALAEAPQRPSLQIAYPSGEIVIKDDVLAEKDGDTVVRAFDSDALAPILRYTSDEDELADILNDVLENMFDPSISLEIPIDVINEAIPDTPDPTLGGDIVSAAVRDLSAGTPGLVPALPFGVSAELVSSFKDLSPDHTTLDREYVTTTTELPAYEEHETVPPERPTRELTTHNNTRLPSHLVLADASPEQGEAETQDLNLRALLGGSPAKALEQAKVSSLPQGVTVEDVPDNISLDTAEIPQDNLRDQLAEDQLHASAPVVRSTIVLDPDTLAAELDAQRPDED